MAKQPLGRGLSALLGEHSEPAAGPGNPHEIDIDLVSPNPDQPRTRFADEQLDELARSIAANGIVQPIVVRKKGDRYEIVARGIPEDSFEGAQLTNGQVVFTVAAPSQRETLERIWLLGGEVLSVNPVRRTLEDLFLELTGRGGA